MARPPRVPVMLPWECKVIYFLTLCVVPRRDVLANDVAWRALCQTLERLDKMEHLLRVGYAGPRPFA